MNYLLFDRLTDDALLPSIVPAMLFETRMHFRARRDFELPGKTFIRVRTGLAVRMPRDFFGQTSSMPDLSLRGIHVVPEFLWPFHQDEEIVLTIKNESSDKFSFERGDEIAQLMIYREEAFIPRFTETFIER